MRNRDDESYHCACCVNYSTSKPSDRRGIWCDSFSTTEIAPAKEIGSYYASSGATTRTPWYCNKYENVPPIRTPIKTMTFAPTPKRTPKATLITLAQKHNTISPLIFILSFALQ